MAEHFMKLDSESVKVADVQRRGRAVSGEDVGAGRGGVSHGRLS